VTEKQNAGADRVAVRVERGTTAGRVRPLHGVGNGPLTYGALVDVTDAYKAARIPFVRIHDPNWPHAWEVDVHTIFPDFSKDPADPANYDFLRTDDYIASIVATGAEIIYRLGESIEHTAITYFVTAPSDPAKWAEICAGIVRHYNHGWADGFEYGIRRWEVWNETDVAGKPEFGPNGFTAQWIGTQEDYFTLYEATARRLSEEFPGIMVGGPAATSLAWDVNEDFVARCRDRGIPLDFFSWHTYTADLSELLANARRVA
jgi:xylan 1,4-beta-xylosidase